MTIAPLLPAPRFDPRTCKIFPTAYTPHLPLLDHDPSPPGVVVLDHDPSPPGVVVLDHDPSPPRTCTWLLSVSLALAALPAVFLPGVLGPISLRGFLASKRVILGGGVLNMSGYSIVLMGAMYTKCGFLKCHQNQTIKKLGWRWNF